MSFWSLNISKNSTDATKWSLVKWVNDKLPPLEHLLQLKLGRMKPTLNNIQLLYTYSTWTITKAGQGDVYISVDCDPAGASAQSHPCVCVMSTQCTILNWESCAPVKHAQTHEHGAYPPSCDWRCVIEESPVSRENRNQGLVSTGVTACGRPTSMSLICIPLAS